MTKNGTFEKVSTANQQIPANINAEDNRSVIDTNSAQALTENEIVELKKDKTGSEVVELLT